MELPVSIKDLHKDLIAKKYSVSELVDYQLKRIDKLDAKINSFITVTKNIAIIDAKKTDSLIKENGSLLFKKLPLSGVTVGYKDLFLTKGVQTTAASNVLKGYIPQYSSTAYQKLNESGSIMLGKNNCDAWAHGASGENSDFGATKNPWNLEFVPGGSSSGPAAAVASGFVHLGMGTDTGGSVRQPASFCNLVGLKPTYGNISRYGVVAMASSLDTVGHFTKCVDDSRRVYNVLKGQDSFDATVKKASKQTTPKTLTVGIPDEYFAEGVDKNVLKLIEDAINLYKKSGVKFKKVSLPHTKYAISVYYIIQPAEVSSNLGRYDAIRYGNGRDAFGNEAKRRIMLGTYVLSAGFVDAYYKKAQKVRSLIIDDFAKVFNQVDALIAPVSPTPPFKLGEKASDPLKMYLADVLTAAANLTGIPGMSVPAGFSRNGLPVGFQLLGPRFSEDLLFDIAEIYERVTNWHNSHPKL